MARAVNLFADFYAGGGLPAPDWPLTRHVDITPSDTEGDELPWVTRALNVNKECDVAVIDQDDVVVTLHLTPGDNFHCVRQVLETGTTADVAIVGCA